VPWDCARLVRATRDVCLWQAGIPYHLRWNSISKISSSGFNSAGFRWFVQVWCTVRNCAGTAAPSRRRDGSKKGGDSSGKRQNGVSAGQVRTHLPAVNAVSACTCALGAAGPADDDTFYIRSRDSLENVPGRAFACIRAHSHRSIAHPLRGWKQRGRLRFVLPAPTKHRACRRACRGERRHGCRRGPAADRKPAWQPPRRSVRAPQAGHAVAMSIAILHVRLQSC